MIDPGVYFGMPEDEYHRIPALSSTGIKWLRVSPLDFWVRSNWNPDLEAVLAEEGDTEARILGRAFDCRIVEGKEAFEARYVREIEIEEYPGALRTVDDIKAELRKRDLPLGGKKDELTERILRADPSIRVWDEILKAYAGDHAGKTFLSPKWIRKIEIAAAMIEKHPTLKHAFTGGAPQVTIIWEADGILCKARLDYLKPRAIVDLKTITSFDKPLEIAIAREIASRKYHIQAAFYDEAVAQMPRLAAAGRVFNPPGGSRWLDLITGEEKQFLFVFQRKGVAPTAEGVVLPKSGTTFQIGQREVENGKELFKTCVEKYGLDVPWVNDGLIKTLDDTAIPPWAFE